MKIIKEDLDNLERVDDRQTVQGIMMKDAEEQSKKSEDNFIKDRSRHSGEKIRLVNYATEMERIRIYTQKSRVLGV